MTLLTKALLVLVLALSLGVGVQTWRVKNAQRAGTEAALAPAKEAAASAKATVETVTVQLAAIHDTVVRVLHSLRTDTLTLRPQTRQDTATALAQLPVLAAHFDTLQTKCTALDQTCAAYRRDAELRFRADSTVIAKQDAIIAERPMPKHWRFGVTGGYGATLSHGQILTGPSLSAGVTWTPFN